MDTQPTAPVESTPPPSMPITPITPLPSPRRGPGISLVLIVVLGLGTIIFGLAAITSSGQAHTAKTTLANAKQTAATQAAQAQKQTDAQAAEDAAESPYQTYTAPDDYGSFVISFPKNWSSAVDLEDNAQNQVTLVMQPGIIRTVNGVGDLIAAEVLLINRQLPDYLSGFNKKKVAQTNVTVDGIASVQLTGSFPDGRATTLVAVPIRDKTLVFDNEDSTYASQFQTIVAQAKLNP